MASADLKRAPWTHWTLLTLLAHCAYATPPAAPVITEPAVDGQIVNPADVHMETGPFSDPDPGDDHFCSDWEIWTISPAERVWVTACIGGVERVHSHLGDGVFENSHAGRSELFHDTQYRMRTRHRDDSPGMEWSAWSERLFITGPATEVFPLELDDILDAPTPQWSDVTGAGVILAADPNAPSMRVESAIGEWLLVFRGQDGVTNEIINPPALAAHVAVRVVVRAGSSGAALLLPETELTFFTHDGQPVTIYLPNLNLPPVQAAYFWVAADGSTYVGHPSQLEPDFSTLARGAPVPWTVKQTGYKVEVAATGFQLPVNIAFVPNPGPLPDDPYYYVSELYGQIKVVSRDGTVSDYATGLLNFDPTGAFPGSGEQGLTGIVVDPATGDVYACMLYDDDGPHYPKVDRFTSLDGGRTAATQTTILDMVGETQGQSHQVSNLSIGPDGKLYVHMGDGFDASTAQNLDVFRGKILRLNLDGSAPTDNPFYDAGNGINARDYVYAYGFRNPFGGAWRDADGMHYEVENGPSTDRFARVVAGRNYLWDGSNGSMFNFAIYNWDPAHAPVNLTFIQPSVFGGSGFPAGKLDHAFVTESGPTWGTGPQANGKRITEFVLDASGDLVAGPIDLVEYNGTGKATAAAIAAGPDGLYFSDLYKDRDFVSPIDRGANVLRIRFVGTADFVADVTIGSAPLTVQFTDLSNVPSPTEWHWDFGDGGHSDEQNPLHTYTAQGTYDVQLRVTGANGVQIAYKPGYIRVGDFARVALIGGSASPAPGDAALADYLRARGYDVETYDDNPGNRPTAAQLAADNDVVILSSTIASGNIAGEFRSVDVALIHWESALNSNAREPLCSGGGVVGGSNAIDIVDNQHPVTAGLPLGTALAFNPAANMSVGRNTLGPDVDVLATRSGAPGDYAIMVAEQGALLLGGHVAPARRVFLFLEDESWLSATPITQRILEQAVQWAADEPSTAGEVAFLPLAHNFNGMVHAGEAGSPDDPDGFRSISDRGLLVDGGDGAFSNLIGPSGIAYRVEPSAGTLDIVHLGNRNAVDNGNWAFDASPDGDAVGIRPNWLPNPDQTGPQVTDLSGLDLTLAHASEIGVLYNISNGGGGFEVDLAFTDLTTATLTLTGPDWFGEQTPPPAGPGVASQTSLGTFAGAGNVDEADPSGPLNVVEAVISVHRMEHDGVGDVAGKTLASITFGNAFNSNGYAIFAATLRTPPPPPCPGDTDGDGDVDLADLSVLLSQFGTSGTGLAGDLDGDGDVDLTDLSLMLSSFGQMC